MTALQTVAGTIAILFGLAAGGCNSSPCSLGDCTRIFKKADKVNLALVISEKSASLSEGISLRIQIINKSGAPQVLEMCPVVNLCCVKNLHPTIGYDGRGMSLLDVCKNAKPEMRETVLPSGAELAFDVCIPAARLPEDARKEGKKIQVSFCYVCDDATRIESNSVEVMLK